MECCDGIGVIVFGEDWSLWVIAPFKLHFLRTPCLHDVVRWVLHLLGKVSFQNENACLVAAGTISETMEWCALLRIFPLLGRSFPSVFLAI